MPINPQILTYILAGLLLLLLIWNLLQQMKISRLNKNQRLLFRGRKGADLEEIILSGQKKMVLLENDIKDLFSLNKQTLYLAQKGLHKVGVIRFNPFRDLGGDQSFAIALIDHENSGVIISSLYSRDGVRVYAKAIKDGKNKQYPLTEEEKQAIKIASLDKVV